ncbi:MAG: hypothetical protein K9L62_15915 [Vallitaleaceae bacterium]|nr:hypothetical protein [Vallitaleaceae bacterium]
MPKNDNKKVTVNGTEYHLQHPGVEWIVDHSDKCTNAQGNLVRKKYIQGLLDHVIIKPNNLTLNDFDTVSDMRDVVNEVESFL